YMAIDPLRITFLIVQSPHSGISTSFFKHSFDAIIPLRELLNHFFSGRGTFPLMFDFIICRDKSNNIQKVAVTDHIMYEMTVRSVPNSALIPVNEPTGSRVFSNEFSGNKHTVGHLT